MLLSVWCWRFGALLTPAKNIVFFIFLLFRGEKGMALGDGDEETIELNITRGRFCSKLGKG
jgi:hypothetical protein